MPGVRFYAFLPPFAQTPFSQTGCLENALRFLVPGVLTFQHHARFWYARASRYAYYVLCSYSIRQLWIFKMSAGDVSRMVAEKHVTGLSSVKHGFLSKNADAL
jgi:hypothetical protein